MKRVCFFVTAIVYIACATWAKAEVMYFNDFENLSDPLKEWSNSKTDSTPSGRRFLGQFQNDTVSLTLDNLPAHTEITLSFDLYVIRSWDGLGQDPDIWDLSVSEWDPSEQKFIKIDTLLRTTFGNCHWADPVTSPATLRQAYPGSYPGGDYPIRTGAAEVDTLGYIMGSYNADSVYNLTFTFAHSASSLQLNFSAENLQDYDPLDESWGLDNVALYSAVPEPVCTVSDDFEDGVIDTSLWVAGGSRGGVGGPGSGGGQWYNEEIVAEDGYLQARATTPISGGTNGAQAWTRTVYNFNDGRDWIINFKWETDIQTVGQWHADFHLIEITDGRTTGWSDGKYYPPQDQVLPGTQQLYLEKGVEVSAQTWSIFIDSTNAVATLYEGPDASGEVHSMKTLDGLLPWYVRFITVVATSAGFPAKDCRINLYDFSAVCGEVGPADLAAIRIREAIAEKVETLERIDVALEKEWAAYEALEELIESGDCDDLKKGDIVAAKQKIHSAIQHQEQSKKALEKSIEKLKDALAVLGRPLLPNTIQCQ